MFGCLYCGSGADERRLILFVIRSVHHQELVQEGVDAVTVRDQVQHQLGLREGHEGVSDVGHPEQGRLST